VIAVAFVIGFFLGWILAIWLIGRIQETAAGQPGEN